MVHASTAAASPFAGETPANYLIEMQESRLGRAGRAKPSILAGFGAARSLQDLCSLAAEASAAAAAATAAASPGRAGSHGFQSGQQQLRAPPHLAASPPQAPGGTAPALPDAAAFGSSGGAAAPPMTAINRRRSLDSCRRSQQSSRHAPRPRHEYAPSPGRGSSISSSSQAAAAPANAAGASTPAVRQPAASGLLSLPQPLLQRILLTVPGGPGRDGGALCTCRALHTAWLTDLAQPEPASRLLLRLHRRGCLGSSSNSSGRGVRAAAGAAVAAEVEAAVAAVYRRRGLRRLLLPDGPQHAQQRAATLVDLALLLQRQQRRYSQPSGYTEPQDAHGSAVGYGGSSSGGPSGGSSTGRPAVGGGAQTMPPQVQPAAAPQRPQPTSATFVAGAREGRPVRPAAAVAAAVPPAAAAAAVAAVAPAGARHLLSTAPSSAQQLRRLDRPAPPSPLITAASQPFPSDLTVPNPTITAPISTSATATSTSAVDWEEGWSPAAATAEERAAAAAAALAAAVTAGGDCGVVPTLLRLVPAGGTARAELDRVVMVGLGRRVAGFVA